MPKLPVTPVLISILLAIASAAALAGAQTPVAAEVEAGIEVDADAEVDAEAATDIAIEAATGTPTLATVVVSGVQPGPGLWRVSDQAGHALWILGTLSPVPRRMRWESAEVERVLAEAGSILTEPGATVRAKVGLFAGLGMLPTAMRARNNPERQRLVEIVPEADYRRWTVLRQRHLGSGTAIEKRRPILAADALFREALDDSGLTADDRVWPVLRKLARKHEVEIVDVRVAVEISDPKAALKQFAREDLDDLPCFTATLTRLETDLEAMRQRANAWAIGDIETLRELPYRDQEVVCAQAMLASEVAREQGITDLPARVRAAWLDAAEAALARDATSFAVLPMRTLLAEDGLLAELGRRGYRVEQP